MIVTGYGGVLASRHGCTREARFVHVAQTPVGLVQEGHGMQKPMHAWLPCCLSAWCGSICWALLAENFGSLSVWTVPLSLPIFGELPVLQRPFGDDRAFQLPQRCLAGSLYHCLQSLVGQQHLIITIIISSLLLLNSSSSSSNILSILKTIRCTGINGRGSRIDATVLGT